MYIYTGALKQPQEAEIKWKNIKTGMKTRGKQTDNQGSGGSSQRCWIQTEGHECKNVTPTQIIVSLS